MFMLSKTKVMFFLALVLASGAAWLANAYVQKSIALNKGSPTQIATVKVAVAALPITFGQKLEGRHIKMIDWPKELAPPGALSDMKDLDGWIALQDISVDEVITRARLAQHLDGSRLSALVTENKRAMTMRVDDVVGVAGFILPGNHVDVLGVRLDRTSNNAIVRTVVSDVKVLAVDQEVSPDEKKPKIVRAVTLEVTPAQSEELVKAAHEGQIQLTLRNPMDKQMPAPKPEPVKKVHKPIVAKVEQEKPYQVTIIRGSEIRQEKPTLQPK